MKTKALSLIASSLFCIPAMAQTTAQEMFDNPERCGGVYYAYPTVERHDTPAPKGFKPFYVSHYGRHGSRYLISDNDYKWVLDAFHKADAAGALTPFGHNVMDRLDSVWVEARGRGGELSPLGARQHRAIANRLYHAYPGVFTDDAEITAKSTTVMRCAHSMFAFVEGLKENNPKLQIPRESGERAMVYLNYHSPESGPYAGHEGPWYQDYRKFKAEKTNPHRMMKELFNDSLYVRRYVDPEGLMWGLYWVAVDMQNMESDISFFDVFTPQELFDLWQVFNFNFFACNSSYAAAEGQLTGNARNLVCDIVAKADRCIASGEHGADFRFGHDGNIIPLAALMRLTNCYTDEMRPERLGSVWSDFKISPMASNLQMIFFRNKKGDILVKIMLNEREIAVDMPSATFPFYRWDDLRAYLLAL